MACEARLGGGVSMKGTVRDVSEAGLAILTPVPAKRPMPEQGEPIQVRLDPTGCSPAELEALVWHVHRVRKTSNGEAAVMLGLVLAAPCDAFFQLLQGLRSGSARDRAKKVKAKPAAAAAPAAPLRTPPPARYSIRVKQNGGPSSHRIVVAGESLEAAKEYALAELGSGWTILEARRI